MQKLGIRTPSDAVTGSGPHAFHDDGMHYELCQGDNGRLYVAADHEDVGLVTWFDVTLAEWNDILTATAED